MKTETAGLEDGSQPKKCSYVDFPAFFTAISEYCAHASRFPRKPGVTHVLSAKQGILTENFRPDGYILVRKF